MFGIKIYKFNRYIKGDPNSNVTFKEMGVFFCLIVLVCNGLLCKAQDNFDNYEKIPENEWVIPDIVPGNAIFCEEKGFHICF